MRNRNFRITTFIMPDLPKVFLTMPFFPISNGGQFSHLTLVNRSFVPVCHLCISVLSFPLSKHSRNRVRSRKPLSGGSLPQRYSMANG